MRYDWISRELLHFWTNVRWFDVHRCVWRGKFFRIRSLNSYRFLEKSQQSISDQFTIAHSDTHQLWTHGFYELKCVLWFLNGKWLQSMYTRPLEIEWGIFSVTTIEHRSLHGSSMLLINETASTKAHYSKAEHKMLNWKIEIKGEPENHFHFLIHFFSASKINVRDFFFLPIKLKMIGNPWIYFNFILFHFWVHHFCNVIPFSST